MGERPREERCKIEKKKKRRGRKRRKKKTAIQTSKTSHQLPVDRVGQALLRELGACERGLVVDAGEQEAVLDDLGDLFFSMMMNWFRSRG